MIGAHEKHATPEAVALAHQLSANIPTLHTDRLTLRPLKLEDFATLADLLASDRSRFVGGPMSRMDAWQELTQLASGWVCLLYTSPSPRDKRQSRMPSSA